jgi:hypothetical protein
LNCHYLNRSPVVVLRRSLDRLRPASSRLTGQSSGENFSGIEKSGMSPHEPRIHIIRNEDIWQRSRVKDGALSLAILIADDGENRPDPPIGSDVESPLLPADHVVIEFESDDPSKSTLYR